jgi:glycosyltransferase involved in cell wall biosynthesis
MKDQVVCSVIIPSYHSLDTIGTCLTALSNQDFALPYEIIVVDSSSDETPQLIRRDFPQVHLIHLPQQTDPALARNIGAQQAQGKILAFIDADCIASPDWLGKLYATLQSGYEAVGGAIANGNGKTLASWAGYFCEFREFLPGDIPRDVNNLTLGNAAYRRESFLALGGFPTGYFPQEDQVFHRLFGERGMKIRYDPRITVAHHHRSQARAFLQHQSRIGRANAQVLKKIDLSGSNLARHPWLALLAMPGLIPFRFIRTLIACRQTEQGLILRQPLLAGLCLLGMLWWGWGFLRGAFAVQPPAARTLDSKTAEYSFPVPE